MAEQDKISFSWFKGNTFNTVPNGTVSLEYFIEAQRNPKDELKKIFDRINYCEENDLRKEKDYLKQNKLFYFTPCLRVNYRSYAGIEGFSGLMVLDFDHIDNAEDFRDFIFDTCKYIVCAYTSPSRKGVKCLVRIPICKSIEEFKSYYFGLAHFMCKYKGFDGTAQSPILPVFTSWDKNIRYRDNADIWVFKGEKVDSFTEYEGDLENFDKTINPTKADISNIKSMIYNILKKADEDECGHPKVLSASLLIGGYSSAGYIPMEEAKEYLFECIDKIDYYSKGTSGYKRTANNMLIKGATAPLKFVKNK